MFQEIEFSEIVSAKQKTPCINMDATIGFTSLVKPPSSKLVHFLA